MNIKISSVNFLPNGDIKVVYKKDGSDHNQTIPAIAVLRKATDAILIEKIKAALNLPG